MRFREHSHVYVKATVVEQSDTEIGKRVVVHLDGTSIQASVPMASVVAPLSFEYGVDLAPNNSTKQGEQP